nr:calymmin [Misgurnus anguillicaudatus]
MVSSVGQSAFLPAANGNQAQFKGFGALATAKQNGYGGKPNGYGGPPAVAPGNNGQSAFLPAANGNGAQFKGQNVFLPAANGNGAQFKGFGALAAAKHNGYGAKPNAPVVQNGYGGKSMNYGAVSAMANGQEAKPNGGYKSKQTQPGYGGHPPYGGIGMGMMKQQPANQRGGYGNGYGYNHKAPAFGGYGMGPGAPNGQGTKPNGYGVPSGYPNGGAAKGPKPGFGGAVKGPNTGYGVPSGYPNGGAAKGPKPGFGGAVKGPNAGYGLPAGITKGVKSGYAPIKNGNGGAFGGNGPKGEHLPASSNTKGILPLADHESSTRLPSALQPTKDIASVLQQTKGPRALLPQGKAPKPLSPYSGVPQGMFSNQFVQGPSSYKPGKAYKPAAHAPVASQTKGLKPDAPIVSQKQEALSAAGSAPKGKAPKQFPQVPETVAMGPQEVITQEQSMRPVVPQPITPQAELAGLGQTNGQQQQQQAKPTKPDCGPGGRPNGQWIKLPSPGSMYPKQNGAKPSHPAFGAGVSGSAVPGMTNGYKGQAVLDGAVKGKAAGPQGMLPKGLGSKGKSQTKYGIGGRAFGGSPNGYQMNPFGKYGNGGLQYGTKPYNAGGTYGFGGLPYNNQPFGHGGDKFSGKHGFGGLPNGGQSFGLGTDAKSVKYGNPAVPYEFLGPVTDGQSVEESRNLEALHQGPQIDGQKSIDHFGEGEVPPQPDQPAILAAVDQPAKSTDKYETGHYANERIQPEVVSFPAAPTEGPVPDVPAITSFDSAHLSTGSSLSLEGSPLALLPVPVESAVSDVVSEVSTSPLSSQPELPTLMLQPAPPQQIHIQQHMKFHFHPQGKSQTGGKEDKYHLNGFFGSKYQG